TRPSLHSFPTRRSSDLALHASAAQMGALTTAYLVPNLLFSLHAGVWIDRRGKRRETMLLADFARGLLTLTIPVAYALGDLTWARSEEHTSELQSRENLV